MHIQNYFSQSKNRHHKRKAVDLGESSTQKNESVPQNIKRRLQSLDVCHAQSKSG